jgi:hypothetical protein
MGHVYRETGRRGMTIGDQDLLRVTAIMQSDYAGAVVNVYHMIVTGIVAQTQQQILDDITEYVEAIYLNLNASISGAIKYDSIEVFNVSTDEPEPVQSWPTLTQGADAGDLLPDAVCGLVIGRTAKSRRLGKKYFGGATEGSQTGGLWTASYLLNLALAGADWITPATFTNGVDVLPIIRNYLTGLYWPFTEVVARGLPAYQRRRKRGVGV